MNPARTYYEGCVGTWRSPVQITLTDREALARSGMSWLDRLSVRLLAERPSWMGEVFLDTEVAFRGADEVVHTTTVRWSGVPVQRSVEVFALQPDGRTLAVSGGMTGQGEVDPTGAHARYTLRWLGVTITQQTDREPDRVTVRQQGPGFEGLQVLRRR